MKIVVLMCVWRHLNLSGVALDYLAKVRDALAGDVEIDCVVAGSEPPESMEIATRNGFTYVASPNNPVGAKFNKCLRATRGLDPDAVMVLGSDNFANPALFRKWAEAIEGGVDYVGFLDATILNIASKRLIRWHGYPIGGRRFGELMGSGRCFSRGLLEEVNWSLWDGTIDRNLDWSVTVKLNSLGRKFPAAFRQGDDGLAHLGVKTGDAITAFTRYVRKSAMFTDMDAATDIDKMFGFGLYENLAALGRNG